MCGVASRSIAAVTSRGRKRGNCDETRARARVLPARNNAHVAPMPQRYFQSHDQAAFDHIFLVH